MNHFEELRQQAAMFQVGDHFIQDNGRYDFAIYGVIRDAVEDDRKLGADEEELQHIRDVYAMPHMKHMRPCKCFSPVVMDGEYGDVHVANMTFKLTEKQFEVARALGWPRTPTLLKVLQFGKEKGMDEDALIAYLNEKAKEQE